LSEDPKKPGGEADDLLSKLFDIDEPKAASSKDSFSKPTRVSEDVSEQTEFGASPDSANEADDKQSLDALLGADSVPSGKFQNPSQVKSITDASSKMNLGDNLFDGILEEEPLPDDKINFFSASSESPAPAGLREKEEVHEKTAMVTGEKKNPFAEDAPGGKTVELEEEVPDESPKKVSAKTSVPDPIDEALLNFAENGKVESGFINSAKSEPTSASSPEDSMVNSADEKEELSSKDFADVFATGPIQVSEATARARPSSTHWKRHVAIAAGLILTAGAFWVGYAKIKTDEGLFGYRLEGLSLVKGYRPPSEEERNSFTKVFADSQMARAADDPKKIEDAITPLESILTKDPRNLEAAGLILEHQGILLNWYGVGSSWAQQFDQSLQRLEGIYQKTQKRPSVEAVDRAYAWRLMAIGDFQKAGQELEAKLSHYPSPEDSTFGLLAELASRRGDGNETDKWLKKINKKVSPRIRMIQALSDPHQRADLSKLSEEGYLPAVVAAFISQDIKKETASDAIASSEKILENTKKFPSLSLQVHAYRGDLFSFTGHNDRAREEWKIIVEKFPKDASLWTKLANSYEEDALWDEAVDAYKSAQKAGASDQSLVIRLAHLLHIRGKIVDALAILDHAITAQPTSPTLLVEKGRVQLAIYQDSAAKTSFEKALALKADLEEAILGLADIGLRTKDLIAAETQFKKIPEKSSRYPEALKGLAGLAQMKHDSAKARALYSQALKIDPKLETAYPQLVKLYLMEEKDAEAEALVNKGLETLPRSPLLKVALARIHQFQGEVEQALKDLEPVRKSYSHITEVSYALADILIDHKEYAEAWKVLSPLVAKELRDSELLYLQAKAYFENAETARAVGSNEAAYRLAEAASHRDPENAQYRVLAAQLALRLQDKPTAFEHIDAVLKYNSAVAPAYIVRGDIQMDNGEYAKATASYQEAMKYTRFRSPIYHRLAESFKSLGKSALAIQYYKKVTQERTQDAEPYVELGKLYNEEGHFQAAMQALKKAISLNPKISESYYFLGFIQKELGDKNGAIESFEKFLSLEPSSTESATIRDEVYFLKNGHSEN
jgi:tetratricopeptide (TPR) repeat protein